MLLCTMTNEEHNGCLWFVGGCLCTRTPTKQFFKKRHEYVCRCCNKETRSSQIRSQQHTFSDEELKFFKINQRSTSEPIVGVLCYKCRSDFQNFIRSQEAKTLVETSTLILIHDIS